MAGQNADPGDVQIHEIQTEVPEGHQWIKELPLLLPLSKQVDEHFQ
jgi:hypothetical protein